MDPYATEQTHCSLYCCYRQNIRFIKGLRGKADHVPAAWTILMNCGVILVVMRNVQEGSRGFEVAYLQRLLNLRSGAALREDGLFGPRTRRALEAWQSSTGRPRTGSAGQAEFQQLGMQTCFEHPVVLVGQPTSTSCWSAAMTMMRGSNRSIGPGAASLGALGGLQSSRQNVETFARQNGLRVLSSMTSYGVPQLCGWLSRGPVLAIGAGHIGPRAFSHACVLSGIISDHNPNGSGTVIRIHDPEPVGIGSIGWAWFGGATQWTPVASYELFGAYLIGA
ncbi:MAG: papain-like cysteine protease family protein [Acidobacteriota bacterium]